MNADDPTPRVGFAQLKNMIGRKVLFVGRVESMDGGVAQMLAPDGSRVAVQAASMYETPYAEVTGVVVDPQTIREESHVNFGENFGALVGVVGGLQRAGVVDSGDEALGAVFARAAAAVRAARAERAELRCARAATSTAACATGSRPTVC